MSINVTVTGNPVSIKRGKMVTAAADPCGKDFQKRRRMRIEQVRQQSKEIAEDVRNKVRRERTKQTSNFEKESARKVDEMKNRKLLELQNQYADSVKDIGSGHKQAIVEEMEEAAFVDGRDRFNEEQARERGEAAAVREQISRNERSHKGAVPKQTRRMIRDAENARAAQIVRKARTPNKKRKTSITNIHISNSMAADSESDVHEIVELLSNHNSSSDASEVVEYPSQKRKIVPKANVREAATSPIKEIILKPKLASEMSAKRHEGYVEKSPRKKTPPSSPNKRVSAGVVSPRNTINETLNQNAPDSAKKSGTSLDFSLKTQVDTRISDRIRNRKLSPEASENRRYTRGLENKENNVTNKLQRMMQKESIELENPYQSSYNLPQRKCDKCRQPPSQVSCTCEPYKYAEQDLPACKCLLAEPLCVNCRQSEGLPSKPTVSLRPSTQPSEGKKNYYRVQHYDHDNRFAKNYIVDNSNVQRIPEESLEVCADDPSEGRFEERRFEREKVAEQRGKRALEKERIKKDYEDLMRKLPVLLKQDRIAALDPAKDKYHMSEDRLKEAERKRQHRMETAFERIGIPSKERPKSPEKEEPIQVVRNAGNNFGTWKKADSDTDSLNVKLRLLIECLQTRRKAAESNSVSQKTSDAATLKSNVENLVKKRGSLSSLKKKRSRSKTAKRDAPLQSPKHRAIKDILILQNMSTQTSPKVETSPKVIEAPKQQKEEEEKLCEGKCKCEGSKLCEILIKIKDGDKSEILISNEDKNDTVKIDIEESAKNEKKSTVKPPPPRTETDSRARVRSPKRKRPERPSWKEHLSKNETNSSTSYYSPPDFAKKQAGQAENVLLNLLQKKPQQSNVDKQGRKSIDPRLLAYIKKLLLMSKSSVDNLYVSSVSDVPTPSSSIIDTEENNPERKLQSVLKHFNINIGDVIQSLNQPRDKRGNVSGLPQESQESPQFESTRSSDARNLTLEEYTQLHYPNITSNITKVTNQCVEKIQKLNDQIEKLRSDRQQILSPANNSAGSDKDNTTSYLNLPSHIIDSSETSRSISPEQQKLTEQLLQVDIHAAQNDDLVRKLTNAARNRAYPDDIDKDLIDRYLKLVDSSKSSSPTDGNDGGAFYPILLNIPKLPKLDSGEPNVGLQQKRPPPAKGLNVVRKFTDEIKMYPHELSTIPEVDSVRKSTTPEKPAPNNFTKLLELVKTYTSTESESTQPRRSVHRKSDPKLLSKIIETLQDVSTESSTEKSGDNLEAALKSMGIGWAATTLRKTKEALAHHSSTSSSFENGKSTTSLDNSAAPENNSATDKHQRTSTPMQTTRSSEKSKAESKMFAEESDISSVPDGSSIQSEIHFISIPNVSNNV